MCQTGALRIVGYFEYACSEFIASGRLRGVFLQTGKQLLSLLQAQSRAGGMTVVIITHNSALTAMADRVIRVKSGQIAGVRLNEHPTPVEQIEW